jgi:hypothetical protein
LQPTKRSYTSTLPSSLHLSAIQRRDMMSPHRGINQLPAEMLDAIIRQCVNLHRCEKNSLLPLRLVCKYFDMAVRKFLFKTIQLEFTRFTRTSKQPDLQLIKNFGCLSEALYCDMMVIRDEGTRHLPMYLYSLVSQDSCLGHCLFVVLNQQSPPSIY